MTEPPPRYQDYLPPPGATPAVVGTPVDPATPHEDSVVVMKNRDGQWHAVWQGPAAPLGEFNGSREDAIEWARQRSPRCWVYSEEHDDVLLLGEGTTGPRP